MDSIKSTIKNTSKVIGVTGATGFIGGAICIELKKRGYTVIGIDLVRREHLIPYMDEFINLDFSNSLSALAMCDTIIHCAGTSLVGPSIYNPSKYYNNNVVKTFELLEWCNWHNKHFMFSSSASIYKTSDFFLRENDPKEPLSPYARSKWMVEQIVDDFVKAYGLKSTIFRYFNACGAVEGIHGQEPDATHIFARLFENETFELNGTDFNTEDGTCVRDYIHVTDIAIAHIKAIEKNAYGIYNLGSGVGYSNLEIINAVGKPYKDVGRRPGDADTLVADNNYAKYMLGWTPLHTLNDIVADLNKWYKRSSAHPAI
jgi:UDP-glucose 4-epimerase